MSYRDMGCGEPRADDAERFVTLSGWVGRRRDHGGLIFVDLRDRSGALQLVIDPERAPDAHAVAHRLRLEEVVRVRGVLVLRSDATRNPGLPTGDVELSISEVEVLGPSEVLPFQLDDEGVDETLRIHHRYLDLRRPAMQRIQKIRVDVTRIMRRYLEDRGFWELETPMLTRSTPEGARDFLVPARLSPGSFYALPQSPQLFKQLLMCAGYDRYYQIARCFRDEAQRADRQLEFTQLDIEMSFVERDEVLALVEGLYAEIWQQVAGVELELPFLRLSYADAMRRYGSDKPDLRYGLEIGDVSDAVSASEFGVFRSAIEAGGIVRGLSVPGVSVTRKDIDELQAFAKEWGGKGLAHLIVEPSGELRSPIAKFLSEAEVAAILEATGAEPGSVVFLAADSEAIVNRVLGALRSHLAERFDLIDRDAWCFLYVVDFPLFKQDEETGGWAAEHHMFTAPVRVHEDLLESDPGAVLSEAYDMVLNGTEMASGSIRINRPDLQQRVFDVIGFERTDAEERFGFLLRALRYGAPPHGGMAPGLDRTVMVLAGTDNLREVIAFPKIGGGYDPLTGAPAPVIAEQLGELGLSVRPPAPGSPPPEQKG
jgi:aspartyl-tRNA synthetase